MPTIQIHAYGRNHNQLWMGDRAPYVECTPKRIATQSRKALVSCIANDGTRSNIKAHIAYLRILTDGVVSEIRFTKYGRECGIRNYQARRPGDPMAPIAGYEPVHNKPRLIHVSQEVIDVVYGEGDPYSLYKREFHKPSERVDAYGDRAVLLATATKVTKVMGGWSGWFVENYLQSSSMRVHGVSKEELEARLISSASALVACMYQ